MATRIKELPALVMTDITKKYHSGGVEVEALKNINLEIQKGEFLAICGPSGSGKSTLLNILSGIDKPTSGYTLFFDKSLNDLNENELSILRGQHLGFIFQFFNLIPVLSAFDNVFYPLVLNGKYSRTEARSLALECLENVGLKDMSARKPAQLSGGQQQRVAIARALAHKPGIIVADEPTGNLDMGTGEAILNLLMDINQKTKTTFVISTHSTHLRDMAGRVVEIKDGELTYDSAR